MYGGSGGPVVDDSGVYSALPGTPPPWADYDDDHATAVTDPASVTLSEFPRDRLRLVEKLGEGLFGEVRRQTDLITSVTGWSAEHSPCTFPLLDIPPNPNHKPNPNCNPDPTTKPTNFNPTDPTLTLLIPLLTLNPNRAP